MCRVTMRGHAKDLVVMMPVGSPCLRIHLLNTLWCCIAVADGLLNKDTRVSIPNCLAGDLCEVLQPENLQVQSCLQILQTRTGGDLRYTVHVPKFETCVGGGKWQKDNARARSPSVA